MIIAGIIIAFLAFTVSACVGLGGSLLLVPGMALIYGTKQGIAIAAVLLAFNNVGKLIAYRKTVPFRAVGTVVILTMIGAGIGASAMLAIPEVIVEIVVITVILSTLITEYVSLKVLRRISSHLLAFMSGCTSGFSGTSGPLKGVALRNYDFTKLYFVGAASAVSFAGDVVKAGIYYTGSLLSSTSWIFIVSCMAVSPIAVLCGRKINRRLGERLFSALFWLIMAGYVFRLIVN